MARIFYVRAMPSLPGGSPLSSCALQRLFDSFVRCATKLRVRSTLGVNGKSELRKNRDDIVAGELQRPSHWKALIPSSGGGWDLG